MKAASSQIFGLIFRKFERVFGQLVLGRPTQAEREGPLVWTQQMQVGGAVQGTAVSALVACAIRDAGTREALSTCSCLAGHLEMVRFLLQAGADQEHKTDEMHTALMEASMDGHVEVARLLLDSGAQVGTPLPLRNAGVSELCEHSWSGRINFFYLNASVPTKATSLRCKSKN